MDNALIIAMILKGLPRHFEPFYIYVPHSNKKLACSELKTELHNFEETLKHRDHSISDEVMKLTFSFSKAMKTESHDGQYISYFTCNGKGHRTKLCLNNNYNKRRKPWCSYCKSTTHKRESHKRRDSMKKVADVEECSFAFSGRLLLKKDNSTHGTADRCGS